MFDQRITNVSYGGPSKVDVTVKEAPTADVARLYGELLNKARSEVLETLLVENELINFQVVRCAPDGLNEKTIVAFCLNGQKIIAEVKIQVIQTLVLSREALVSEVIRIAAGVIAEQLTRANDSLRAGRGERHG